MRKAQQVREVGTVDELAETEKEGHCVGSGGKLYDANNLRRMGGTVFDASLRQGLAGPFTRNPPAAAEGHLATTNLTKTYETYSDFRVTMLGIAPDRPEPR